MSECLAASYRLTSSIFSSIHVAAAGAAAALAQLIRKMQTHRATINGAQVMVGNSHHIFGSNGKPRVLTYWDWAPDNPPRLGLLPNVWRLALKEALRISDHQHH